MGTDVNPVAWENAEIMAMSLVNNPKSKDIVDYFLDFSSFLLEKHGQNKIVGRVFSIGKNSFKYEGDLNPSVPALPIILYETFYKHQF